MIVEHPWMRRGLESLRRRFPSAYWRGRNVFALGEWWWIRGREDAYDDEFWDFHTGGDWDGLAALVLRYCRPQSVVDVGCGQGLLLEALRRNDPALTLGGYDASTTARERARARGLAVDPLDVVTMSPAEADSLARRLGSCDLAVCLEVAEHIPSWHSDKLLTILAGAPRLVFSAAHPNQGGRLHVNEQPARYWIDRLALKGLRVASFDEALRAELQSLSVAPWYRDNVHAFERG